MATLAFAGIGAGASAQTLPTARLLPLALANEAAMESVTSCERSGYRVTATVLDASGLIKAVARGDRAPPHTLDSSRGKAYAVVTLGAIFDTSSSLVLAEKILANPRAAPLVHIPGVLLLAGAVALKVGDEVIGAVGVAGSPGGDKDEACARAGADRIADRLK